MSKSQQPLPAPQAIRFIRRHLPNTMLAEMVHRSPSTLRRWERGESAPDAETAELIVQISSICERLAEEDKPWLVRAWFAAMNPLLGQDSPCSRLAAGDVSAVTVAATIF